MSKPLVIVESPAKAKTIAGFLGSGYLVESSIGHIRDLPRSAADIPADVKGEPWARIGVDVDHDFKPLYIIAKEKKQQVSKLKALVKQASEIYLATDEDREGEAIAWHLLEVLKPKVPVKRMVFHEITKQAIESATTNWREVDQHLVDAQEARRILDRLVGYEVSPVLWKKIMRGLSAGRVQSVATRMLVERERARMRFTAASYWDLDGVFANANGMTFPASLLEVDGRRLASGKDFDHNGELSNATLVMNQEAAEQLADALQGAELTVRSIDEKAFKRSPAPPFITSTLQQEAGRKLRFSSARTMQAAQRLYENGFITYMRTDSTTLSDQAIKAARDQVVELYGREYLPDTPRTYIKKSKNAQEAHEAIRPAGEKFNKPDVVAHQVGSDEGKLYELVWKRTVASQMLDARGKSVQARLAGAASTSQEVVFAASGRTIEFPGFLRAYVEGADDPDAELDDRETHLPVLRVGDCTPVHSMDARGHETQPPARYTEASLVKALEEMGVGRPSTYASIMITIQDRGYVWRKGTALVPSFIAFAVVGLLEQHFSQLVDYGFTASMEDDLDNIAGGRAEAVPWLREFYFGNGKPGLKDMVSNDRLIEIDAREINSIHLGLDETGEDVIIRVGQYGPYVQRGEERASVPDGTAPDELSIVRAGELLALGKQEHVIGEDPESGKPILVKAGRFGPYVQVGEAEDGEKPKTASLLSTMEPATVTLDQALLLLSLPRAVGTHPDGQAIEALNGRYGPYIKKGTDSRSLESEEQIFSITLEQAIEILNQPKRGRGQGAAKPPLRELGIDPVSGKSIVIKEGRFGAYLTEGETNVTVPRGESIEEITLERAADMLAEKRAKGPVTRRKKAPVKKNAGAKKAVAKKAVAKKAVAKKAVAKKAVAKKAVAKKSAAKKTAVNKTAANKVVEPQGGPDGETQAGA